jgi:hypothetical protein
MITTKLTGNLGNHIAYYVSTRAIAEKLGYTWGFNPSPSYDYHNGIPQMNFMNIEYGDFPNNIVHNYIENEVRYNHDGDNTDIRDYDPNYVNIQDNSELFGIFQAPEYFYDRIDDIHKWLEINSEFLAEANNTLISNNITLDENTCLMNFRGGEYRHHGRLIIHGEYYHLAMRKMLETNPNMKFIIITDDVECANQYLPGIPAFHFSIATDYILMKLTKYAILSNSSFPIFAILTNTNLLRAIAPMYWARWNVSTGYWASSQNIYPKMEYLNKSGEIKDHLTCREDARNWLMQNIK